MKPLASSTGPLPLSRPKTAQMATPLVNRLYIDSEMERVSSVRTSARSRDDELSFATRC